MKEERLSAARVFLAEHGFLTLLQDSKVLNDGLMIAAGIKTIEQAHQENK